MKHRKVKTIDTSVGKINIPDGKYYIYGTLNVKYDIINDELFFEIVHSKGTMYMHHLLIGTKADVLTLLGKIMLHNLPADESWYLPFAEYINDSTTFFKLTTTKKGMTIALLKNPNLFLAYKSISLNEREMKYSEEAKKLKEESKKYFEQLTEEIQPYYIRFVKTL